MMKKIIALAIATVTSSAVFASTGAPGFDLGNGLKLNASTSATSAYNWRGADMSNREPSVGAAVGVQHTSGLYATTGMYTVNLGNAKYQNTLEAGYATKIGEIGLKGGLFHSHFSGNRNAGLPASDLSFSEAFVGAEWRGVEASLHYNIDGSDAKVDMMRKGDIYGSLGYMHHIGNFAVGAEVGYYWYDQDGKGGVKNNFSDQRVKAAYQVAPNFGLNASYQLGGKDAYDANWGHNKKFEVGMKYDF